MVDSDRKKETERTEGEDVIMSFATTVESPIRHTVDRHKMYLGMDFSNPPRRWKGFMPNYWLGLGIGLWAEFHLIMPNQSWDVWIITYIYSLLIAFWTSDCNFQHNFDIILSAFDSKISIYSALGNLIAQGCVWSDLN